MTMTAAREPALQTLLSREFPGEHGPIIAPTLYLALYVDPVQPDQVREFVGRSRQAQGARLRFYQTAGMTCCRLARTIEQIFSRLTKPWPGWHRRTTARRGS